MRFHKPCLAALALGAFVLLAAAGPVAADPVLGCFIDTAAYDYPSAGSCAGTASNSPTNSASYEVMGVTWDPDDWAVSWGSSCDFSSWNWCVVYLNPGQCKTQTAYVEDLNAQQTTVTSATACLYRF